MLIRCSKQLASKLPEVLPEPGEESSQLGSWHAHLLTLDRRQCVMFCHDASRYCLFLSGLRKEHFRELGDKWFRQLCFATMEKSGYPHVQVSRIKLAVGQIVFDTATDRSVLGSINIARRDLEAKLYEVSNVLELDPIEVSCWLNKRPVTARGRLLWPDKAMREAVAALG